MDWLRVWKAGARGILGAATFAVGAVIARNQQEERGACVLRLRSDQLVGQVR
jgi:hypothetical protein